MVLEQMLAITLFWMAQITALNDAGGRVQGETGATSYVALDTPTNTILKNGTDDYALTAGELQIGYDEFSDVETVDVNLILGGQGGGAGNTASSQDTHVTMLTALVDERRDCVAFVSPYRAATVGVASSNTATENVVEAFDLCPSSSYVVFDSGYKYMYDKYNDVFRFVPLNGDTAGLCAYTDNVADPWFSPAGLNRGLSEVQLNCHIRQRNLKEINFIEQELILLLISQAKVLLCLVIKRHSQNQVRSIELT